MSYFDLMNKVMYQLCCSDRGKTLNEDISILAEGIMYEQIIANEIYVTAIGKSAIVARKLASSLNSLSIPTFFIDPVEAMHGECGFMQGGMLIAFSNSGKSVEVNSFLKHIKKNFISENQLESIPIVYVSKTVPSAEYDTLIQLPDLREADPRSLIPTISTSFQMVFCDALISKVTDLIIGEFGEEEFYKNFTINHPGGAIGDKLQNG